jgi:predicted peroxiredoxin
VLSDSTGTTELASSYLVEMNCPPADREAVTVTLRTALALREDQSEVTLFLDVEAVQLAVPGCKAQPPRVRQETDRLFEKLRVVGISILVCPHCAEKQNLSKRSMRPGLRFTSQEELEATRRHADLIFEYKPLKRDPSALSPSDTRSI